MDCDGVQHHAGDAIDGFLDNRMASEFEEHLRRCPPCRRDVALEKLSKHLVQHFVGWRTTPPSTSGAILLALRQEDRNNPPGAFPLPWSHIPRTNLLHLTLGTFAAVFFFSQVTTRTDPTFSATAHKASNDMINQSFANFGLMKTGRMTPALVTSVPESLRGYLQRSELTFDPQVLKLQDCTWLGAAASYRRGIGQAHVLYKIGDDLVYVFEVSKDDALNGTRVTLPPAAKRALKQSGWYTDPEHPNCSVVVWKTDEVVCVAVSTMKKSRLVALLTTR